MGAFPYTSICRDCKHVWSGMVFSFTVETMHKGQHAKTICPKCNSWKTEDYNKRETLDWNEEAKPTV